MTGAVSQQHTAVAVTGADKRTVQLRGHHMVAGAVIFQQLSSQRVNLDLVEIVGRTNDAIAVDSHRYEALRTLVAEFELSSFLPASIQVTENVYCFLQPLGRVTLVVLNYDAGESASLYRRRTS